MTMLNNTTLNDCLHVLAAPLHNALFALFVSGVLAYGATFAWYMLANFDFANLLRSQRIGNVDDAFYYFQIARNLAEGKFSTFDGGITQTNGYHPLWMLLITPFHWVFDPKAALFAIKAFEIMLIAGGVALIVLAACLCRLPWILLFVVMPLLLVQPGMLVGMEAAAALFMLGLLFFALGLYARSPARWRWFLAAVAFSLPWVRLEFMAISLAASAALCILEWSWQEKQTGAPLKSLIVPPTPSTFVPLLGALSGIVAYFSYNRLVFGGFVPISGAVKREWSQRRWEGEGGYSLARSFQDALQLPIFNYELLIATGICACTLLVWWSARRSRNREEWLLLVFLIGVFSLSVGHVAKFAQTVLIMHPRWGQDHWYFVPAYLMMALAVPVICYVAIHFVRRLVGQKSYYYANILSAGIVIIGTIFLFVNTSFVSPFSHVEDGSRSTFQRERGDRAWIPSYLIARVMNRVLPDGSIIGTWDAGILGYFSRFPVVNLDGLVNSYDYLHMPKVSDTPGSIPPQYGGSVGITHYVAYHDYGSLNPHGNEISLFEGVPFGVRGIRGNRVLDFRVWPAETMEASSDKLDAGTWFWERMEPHLHFKSDGVGVFVDDGLAQVFVRNCEPERVQDKIFVFSWLAEGTEPATSVQYQWLNPRKNHLGFCVTAFELPNDTVNPDWIETMSRSDYIERLGRRRPAVIRSSYDVYLVENSLIYAKEECGQEDVEARFFLHLSPVDMNDLPDHRKQYSYDNLDFNFDQHGTRVDGTCLAKVPLPQYGITAIRTGQYVRVDGGFDNLWKGGIRLVE